MLRFLKLRPFLYLQLTVLFGSGSMNYSALASSESDLLDLLKVNEILLPELGQIVADYLYFPSKVEPETVGGAAGVLTTDLPNLGKAYCFPNPPSLKQAPKGKINYLCIGKPFDDQSTFEQSEQKCSELNRVLNKEKVRLMDNEEMAFFVT